MGHTNQACVCSVPYLYLAITFIYIPLRVLYIRLLGILYDDVCTCNHGNEVSIVTSVGVQVTLGYSQSVLPYVSDLAISQYVVLPWLR